MGSIPLLWHGSAPQATGGSLLPCGPPWAAGPQLAHHGLHHRLWGNLCSSTWSISSHSFTGLSVCRAVPPTFSHSSLWLQLLLCRFFPNFFNLLCQRRCHHRSQAQPWPAAGPSWSQLALAPLNPGEVSGSFSQNFPLISPPKPCHTKPVHSHTALTALASSVSPVCHLRRASSTIPNCSLSCWTACPG